MYLVERRFIFQLGTLYPQLGTLYPQFFTVVIQPLSTRLINPIFVSPSDLHSTTVSLETIEIHVCTYFNMNIHGFL